MENKEEVLDALEEYNRKAGPKDGPLPLVIENYLRHIANTGETIFPWTKVKQPFINQMTSAMTAFIAESPQDNLVSYPNVENVKCDELKERILAAMDNFGGAPFTIQRLAELVMFPHKHYKKPSKWLRGIEKNINVVSTVDPFGKKVVTDVKPLLANGLDTSLATANGSNSPGGDTAAPPAPFNSPAAVPGWFNMAAGASGSPVPSPLAAVSKDDKGLLGSPVEKTPYVSLEELLDQDEGKTSPPGAKRQKTDRGILSVMKDDDDDEDMPPGIKKTADVKVAEKVEVGQGEQGSSSDVREMGQGDSPPPTTGGDSQTAKMPVSPDRRNSEGFEVAPEVSGSPMEEGSASATTQPPAAEAPGNSQGGGDQKPTPNSATTETESAVTEAEGSDAATTPDTTTESKEEKTEGEAVEGGDGATAEASGEGEVTVEASKEQEKVEHNEDEKEEPSSSTEEAVGEEEEQGKVQEQEAKTEEQSPEVGKGEEVVVDSSEQMDSSAVGDGKTEEGSDAVSATERQEAGATDAAADMTVDSTVGSSDAASENTAEAESAEKEKHGEEETTEGKSSEPMETD